MVQQQKSKYFKMKRSTKEFGWDTLGFYFIESCSKLWSFSGETNNGKNCLFFLAFIVKNVLIMILFNFRICDSESSVGVNCQ